LGNQVKIKTNCNIDANDAWNQLQNFSIPHKYIPFLQNTMILSNQSNGVGAYRRVFTKYTYTDETVIKWEEGSGYTIKLHRNNQQPYPFISATFTYQIVPIDKYSCELIGIFKYHLPFGIIGKILNQLLLGIIIRFNIRRVMMGMKSYYEG